MSERGVDAAERAAVFVNVRNRRPPAVSVAVANEPNVFIRRQSRKRVRRSLDESLFVELEQCLVRAHATACAARKNEAFDVKHKSIHPEMVRRSRARKVQEQ